MCREVEMGLKNMLVNLVLFRYDDSEVEMTSLDIKNFVPVGLNIYQVR
jgi:hypothetical protein